MERAHLLALPREAMTCALSPGYLSRTSRHTAESQVRWPSLR